MRSIILVTIRDGANFDQSMGRRAFPDRQSAETWGRHMVTEKRGLRACEGEQDEGFDEALRYDTEEVSFEGDDED